MCDNRVIGMVGTTSHALRTRILAYVVSTTAVPIHSIWSSMEPSWPVGFKWFALTNQRRRQVLDSHVVGLLVVFGIGFLWKTGSDLKKHSTWIPWNFFTSLSFSSCEGNPPPTSVFPTQAASNSETSCFVPIWSSLAICLTNIRVAGDLRRYNFPVTSFECYTI